MTITVLWTWHSNYKGLHTFKQLYWTCISRMHRLKSLPKFLTRWFI